MGNFLVMKEGYSVAWCTDASFDVSRRKLRI